jgi:hypothetical protein
VQDTRTGFLSFNELADGQGELAISMEYDSTSHKLSIEACALLPHDTKPQDVVAAYLSLCDSNSFTLCTYFSSDSDIPLEPADTLRRHYTCESATLLCVLGSRGNILIGLPKLLCTRSLTDKVSMYKGRPTLSRTVSEVTAFVAHRLLGDDRDERLRVGERERSGELWVA